ncbi:unnamed protein product [Miscanthus lutarioriparius]|uniref:Uncharacterized protein n=1 Tax=Miscanthus lutarioriparius TaxID=422564 RepID=A0A811SRA4_9POAL|nr:unnamed protein product [Miscanthus lutarioriparius]
MKQPHVCVTAEAEENHLQLNSRFITRQLCPVVKHMPTITVSMLVEIIFQRMDRFPLLDPRFDEHHRARRIENGEVLNVLRPMTHEASTTLVYDERFGCGRGFQLGDRISLIPHNLGFLKETQLSPLPWHTSMSEPTELTTCHATRTSASPTSWTPFYHSMFNRQKKKKITNWQLEHQRYIKQDIADIVSEDEGNNPYDQATREGRQVEIAPTLAKASTEIMRTVAEQGRALMIPVGDPDEASMLRQHIQRAMHRLRKVAARLGCRRAPDVAVPQQLGAGPSTAHVGGTSSSHGAHVGGTSSHGAATSAEGGQGHGPYDDEGEHQGEDDEGQGEYYEHEYDEIGMSQLEDAP